MELRFGADTPRRKRAVDGIQHAFPPGRIIAPTSPVFEQAGRVFRALHGSGAGLQDRLGPLNDLLIALTARQIGATVVTNNLGEFRRIAAWVPGLRIVAPVTGYSAVARRGSFDRLTGAYGTGTGRIGLIKSGEVGPRALSRLQN